MLTNFLSNCGWVSREMFGWVSHGIWLGFMRNTQSNIVTAPLPNMPLPKCIAGSSLLAQMIIDKFVDHLPLHRQMQRFERAGVKLPYSTLTDWVSAAANLITPLYESLVSHVLSADYIQCDETVCLEVT